MFGGLLTFVQQDGPEIDVNPTLVRSVRQSTKGGSILSFSDGHCEYVQESPEVTRQKFASWRDAQIEAVVTSIFRTAQKLEAIKP